MTITYQIRRQLTPVFNEPKAPEVEKRSSDFTLIAEKHDDALNYEWEIDGAQGNITVRTASGDQKHRVTGHVACLWKARYRHRGSKETGPWSPWRSFDTGVKCAGDGSYWAPYSLVPQEITMFDLAALTAGRNPDGLVFFAAG